MFKTLVTYVVLFTVTLSGASANTGVRQCAQAGSRGDDSYLTFARSADGQRVVILGEERGRTFVVGSLTDSQIERMRPGRRYAGAAAAGVALPVVTLAGLAAFWFSWGSAGLLLGGAATAGAGISGFFFDTLNPVSQYDRGKLETCFKRQRQGLAPGNVARIRFSDHGEFVDAVRSMRDLVSDARKKGN
jgi:hypothetical protein